MFRASVSGHRSWTSLQQDAQIKQSGDKLAGWKWLPVVTEGHKVDRCVCVTAYPSCQPK
jgi:hypothetical protein